MKLISVGDLTTELVTDMAGHPAVVLTGELDEIRAAAQFFGGGEVSIVAGNSAASAAARLDALEQAEKVCRDFAHLARQDMVPVLTECADAIAMLKGGAA